MHWSGPYKNWNGRCAVCHATGFEKGFDAAAGTFASKAAEIGVGCEACHGPGSAHVAWVDAAASVASSDNPAPANGGFPIDLGERTTQLEQCAGCHSRREPLTEGTPPPGTPYHDAYNLSLLLPGLYQADGQIEDEVYVYGSFLQSKMYAKGVSCGDCHDPHSTRLRADGNAVCTQCHNPAGNTRFPTLAKKEYDSPSHHFHETDTPGAACKNCHMAEKVYMGNDWRADHSFRIPRPDLAERTGASDACTSCHTDRQPAWAAAEIAKRFPASDHRGTHYGEILAAGRSNPSWAAGHLIALARDDEMAGIVRATALWLVARSGLPQAATETAALLADPDPLVRAAAVDVQRLAPVPERTDRLRPLLEDERLNVRIAAARTLLGQTLPPEAQSAQASAEAEWQAAIETRLDYPETQLQRAGMALTRRDFDAAMNAFRTATEMDPQRTEAWVMQVRIAAARGDTAAAWDILEAALEANPFDTTLRTLAGQLGPKPAEQP
nr:cytochrome c3 family protein [Acuticoccus kalidii]